MDTSVAILTETWLSDGCGLEEDLAELEEGTGYGMLVKNCPKNHRGYSTGGVAIVYKTNRIKSCELSLPGNRFEVVCGAGTLVHHKQKVVAIAVYIPPQYTAEESRNCLDFLEESIIHIKGKFKDPYIIISGDFNRRDVDGSLANFPDLHLIDTPPTRGDQKLDKIFVNFKSQIFESGVLKPLENEHGVRSDHAVIYVSARLKRVESFKWIKYTYKKYSEEAANKFKQWVMLHDWEGVYSARTSSQKAKVYDDTCRWAMDHFFPDVTVKRKSTDDPWINNKITDLIEKRGRMFRRCGERTREWKNLNRHITKLIKKRKRSYYDFHGLSMTDPKQSRKFFKNVRAFKDRERPEIWDVRSMWPDKEDHEIANILADYFNKISSEFSPLEECPDTFDRDLPLLEPFQISGRLKSFKKPKSRIGGDLFPSLVNQFHDILAIPLCEIYNTITQTKEWPDSWKVEYVSVIPKNNHPTEIGQLRNISCTLLVSKVYESFLLDWVSEEVKLRDNQFGGVKGCSTAHYLINLWQEILSNADDNRSATVLTVVDFAKAFNRVSHQACLAAFAKKGASTQILQLIATFLSKRSMTVRVGNDFSRQLLVHGGCPQGSILGVFLFNVCSDELEDGRGVRGVLNDTECDVDIAGFFDQADREFLLRGEAAEEPQVIEEEDDLEISEQSGESECGSERLRIYHTSTPMQGTARRPPCPDVSDSPFKLSQDDTQQFVLMKNTVNTRKPKCIVYSSESDNDYPIPEVAASNWTDKDVLVVKYVDDQTSSEKLDVSNSIKMTINGRKIGVKRAMKSEVQFRTIEENATRIGMKVNCNKTQLLCVSAAKSFTPEPYILDSNSNRIECCSSLKCLGFNFSDKPNARHHIECLNKKLRQRIWALRHLRKAGFSQADLVKVYTAMIRPVSEYCCQVYHTLITEEESVKLDRFESHCLRNIYGSRLSYEKMLKKAEIERLSIRRQILFDNFAEKAAASHRFRKWFPAYTSRRTSSRAVTKYKEYRAKTDRLYFSPLFVMRRRLNGKTDMPIRSRQTAL